MPGLGAESHQLALLGFFATLNKLAFFMPICSLLEAIFACVSANATRYSLTSFSLIEDWLAEICSDTARASNKEISKDSVTFEIQLRMYSLFSGLRSTSTSTSTLNPRISFITFCHSISLSLACNKASFLKLKMAISFDFFRALYKPTKFNIETNKAATDTQPL